jgi:5-oxoprolinase (ATP-hydrolysing)/N-methylhydantoinase B
MRFAQNGYYIEKYLKCANCGLLIYGNGIHKPLAGKQALFCSDWCVQWKAMRSASDGPIRLPILHPPLDDRAPRYAGGGATACDIVTMNILDRMVSICRETSAHEDVYSTISTRARFTCAGRRQGRHDRCAEFCPTMIGGMRS